MDKETLRERFRGLGSIPANISETISDHLHKWLSSRLPGTVATYMAMTGEVDVSPLMPRLPGWRWVLPRVETDGSLTFRDRDVPRELHRWGMEQPQDSGAVVPVPELDLILVPGIAFDPEGNRLGRGGGYYDLVLANRRADCTSVGVTSSDRVHDEIPTEAHDVKVDWLATEAGVIRCSPKRRHVR